MQLYQNDLVTIIAILIAMPIELLVFYYILGKDHRTMEYKVSAGFLACINGLIILMAFWMGMMDGNQIIGFIMAPFLLIIPMTVLYFIVKMVRKNRLSLKNTINTSTEASISIANMATELSASASEVNASAEEIASTTQEVSSGALNQVKKITEINQNAIEISDLASSVKNSSDNINNVMRLITNIAEQTNLLALNASIEAGRAGEHGRGFAVVADEVRKLAEESKIAVESSNTEIVDILNKIEKTVNYIDKISQDLNQALSLSEETSAAMEEINSSAEEQTASMEEIAATSNRLGELSEDLKRSLTQKVTVKKPTKKSNKYL